MRIHFIAFWIHFLGVLATPTTILMGYTDYFLFEVPMQDFMLAHTREEGTVAGIDWWWDGCSVAPDRPFGFECTCSLSTAAHKLTKSTSSRLVHSSRFWLPQLHKPGTLQRSRSKAHRRQFREGFVRAVCERERRSQAWHMREDRFRILPWGTCLWWSSLLQS